MIIRPEAEADLEDARNWYERQDAGLGDEFLESVGEAFEKILLMPQLHRMIHQDVRRALTRRFPFAVYYRIENGEVMILAVIHSRRDPRAWKSRA